MVWRLSKFRIIIKQEITSDRRTKKDHLIQVILFVETSNIEFSFEKHNTGLNLVFPHHWGANLDNEFHNISSDL